VGHAWNALIQGQDREAASRASKLRRFGVRHGLPMQEHSGAAPPRLSAPMLRRRSISGRGSRRRRNHAQYVALDRSGLQWELLPSMTG
jgi:hypothetical protein